MWQRCPKRETTTFTGAVREGPVVALDGLLGDAALWWAELWWVAASRLCPVSQNIGYHIEGTKGDAAVPRWRQLREPHVGRWETQGPRSLGGQRSMQRGRWTTHFLIGVFVFLFLSCKCILCIQTSYLQISY